MSSVSVGISWGPPHPPAIPPPEPKVHNMKRLTLTARTAPVGMKGEMGGGKIRIFCFLPETTCWPRGGSVVAAYL